MYSVPSSVFIRAIFVVFTAAAGPWLLPAPAAALKVQINCNLGGTINGALAAHAAEPTLILVLKGICTENVVITRDNATIKTNGIAVASIVAADTNQQALRLDGARRIVIDGVIPNGLTFNGGTVGISASRGSTVDIKNCVVTGTSQNGILSSLGSSVSVDACSVSGNTGNGVVAANTASLGITNSSVINNGMSGIVGVRSSMLRVGQDLGGSLTVRPVTVSGNGSNGIAITESSAGNVVGGTVSQNTGTSIFVGRGSSGQIGLGSNGLTGGVAITNGLSNGISVEGGNATIVFNTITGNQLRGIVVSTGGSARIGVTNNNSVFGANAINGNGSDGIGIFSGGSADIGGNTIDSNIGFGVQVGQAAARVVGGNAITNNGGAGIFARAGQVEVGSLGFGPPITNTISNNGSTGTDNGGIFAFQGAIMSVRDATISNNTGPGVQAFESGVIELRGSTAVTVPAGGTTAGAVVQVGSTLRLRDTASIISGTGDGIEVRTLTSVHISSGTVQGNGPGAVGVNCFSSTSTLTGVDLTHVTGTAGQSAGCNVFP